MYEIDFIIIGKKPSLINRVFTSLIITVYIAYVYYAIKVEFIEHRIDISVILFYLILFLILTSLVTIRNIAIHKIQLNFMNLKIRHVFDIGPLTYREKWQNLNGITYISIFHTKNGFEVNLWDEKKEVLNLFVLQDYDEVMKKAFFVSDKLNVDLLDARRRGHHKWVDKTVYKETGKVEYID